MGLRAIGRSARGRGVLSRLRRAIDEAQVAVADKQNKRYTWRSRHDGKTRESHLELDGHTVDAGDEFPNGCRYPRDSRGPDEEVYGCRCWLEVS